MDKPILLSRSDEDNFSYRKADIQQGGDGTPKTWDSETRSVLATIATETPVFRRDWERGKYSEILLNSGAIFGKKLPLQDSHSRWNTKDTIGSVRDISVTGKGIEGRVYFSSTEESVSPAKKVEEGHLDSFSIGYTIEAAQFVKEDEKAEVDGKMYKGPALIATKWTIKEVSLVAIPADGKAKARSWQTEKQADPVPEPITKKEEEKMDPKLRAFLEARGMQKGLSDEDAVEWASKNTDDSSQKSTGITEDDLKKATEKGEKRALKRSGMLDSMVRTYPELDEKFKAEMLAEKFNTAEINKRALDVIREKSKTGDGTGHRAPEHPATIPDGGDALDKFSRVAEYGLTLRANLTPEKEIPDADGRRSHSFTRLALELFGLKKTRAPNDPHNLAFKALNDTHFVNIMANVLRKQAMKSYNIAAYEQWRNYAGVGSLTDYKSTNIVELSEFGTLNETKRGEDIKFGVLTDSGVSVAMAWFTKGIAIDEIAFINDDMDFLTDIPAKMGRAASRTISNLAEGVIPSNPIMGDGKTLFHADHKNISGLTGAPGIATLDAANLLLMKQTDIDGETRLQIPPASLLAPSELMGTTEQFFISPKWTDGSGKEDSTQMNTWFGKLSRYYNLTLSAVSEEDWYVMAPMGENHLTVRFLNGNQSPRIEQRRGFYQKGIEFTIDISATADITDPRGIVQTKGS